MLVLQLQNYIFFGSAVDVHGYIKKQLKEETEKKEERKGGLSKFASSISKFGFGRGSQYRGKSRPNLVTLNRNKMRSK